MSRSHVNAALALWAAVALSPLSACTDDGLPWGVLDAAVQVHFDPPEGRLDEEGRLKTSADYALALDPIEVTLDAVTIVLAGAGAADFDPANPPEGYSLCHNGHCHSASGALVDYEDIALEMAGGSAGARATVALDGEPLVLEMGTGPVSVEVPPCDPSPCALPMGEMVGLELTVTQLEVSGTAFDRRTGDKARLPEAGVDFSVTVQITQPMLHQIEGSVGPGELVGVRVALDFALPPQLFDDVDFSEPALDQAAWQSFLSAGLLDHEGLEVSLSRFDI